MKNWGHIVNCGYCKLWDYEISDGALERAIGTFHKDHFIKTKLYKLEGNKSLVKE